MLCLHVLFPLARFWQRLFGGSVRLHRARFAQTLELRSLLSFALPTRGLLLGTHFVRSFVHVSSQETRPELGNLLIVGPTRSGKGLLAVSQLLSWQHSVIVNDIKGELFAQTAGYRSKLGKVFVLDPTGVGHCYDPLMGKQTEDELLSAAKHLIYQPDERDKVFTQRAIGMLARLLSAARIEGVAPFPYVRSLIRSSLPTCAKRLYQVDPQLAERFLYSDYEDANFENRFLVSSWDTLTAWLEPLLTETVIRSLTRSDFTPEQLIRGERPVTLYLRWKEQDLLALAPLVRLVWESLLNGLITTYDTHQGEGCNSVLLLIDEAGRTAIPSLADQATTVVGRGITLWIAIQSLAQLEAIYGKARAEILRDNMETQLYYRPVNQETAEYLERCLGKRSDYATTHHVREGEETSKGLAEQGIPLLTAWDIKQLKDEEIIGFHRRLPPFMLKRMDWRQHVGLTERRGKPTPRLSFLPAVEDIPFATEEEQPVDFPTGYIDRDGRNMGEIQQMDENAHRIF